MALVISRWAMEQKLVILFCLGKGQPKGVSSVFWNKKRDFSQLPQYKLSCISEVYILSLSLQ